MRYQIYFRGKKSLDNARDLEFFESKTKKSPKELENLLEKEKIRKLINEYSPTKIRADFTRN